VSLCPALPRRRMPMAIAIAITIITTRQLVVAITGTDGGMVTKGAQSRGSVGRGGVVGGGAGVAWEGGLEPVGGRKSARQLTFQPEAVEATRQSDLPVEALDAKGSPGRISERADHNEN